MTKEEFIDKYKSLASKGQKNSRVIKKIEDFYEKIHARWFKDSCCNLGGVSCKKLALPKLCQKRIRWTEVSRIEKEINSQWTNIK